MKKIVLSSLITTVLLFSGTASGVIVIAAGVIAAGGTAGGVAGLAVAGVAGGVAGGAAGGVLATIGVIAGLGGIVEMTGGVYYPIIFK